MFIRNPKTSARSPTEAGKSPGFQEAITFDVLATFIPRHPDPLGGGCTLESVPSTTLSLLLSSSLELLTGLRGVIGVVKEILSHI